MLVTSIVLREWTTPENALLFEALTRLETDHHDLASTKAVIASDQAAVLSDGLRYAPGDLVPWLNNSVFFDKIVRWGMRKRGWRYFLVEYGAYIQLIWFKLDVDYIPQGQAPFDDEYTVACRLALWAIAAD